MILVRRIIIAVLVYIAIIGLITYLRPRIMFEEDGKVKPWGIGAEEGSSVFSPMFMFPLLALVVFFMVTWIEVIR